MCQITVYTSWLYTSSTSILKKDSFISYSVLWTLMHTVMCHCVHQPVHRVSSATVYHYQWMWFIVAKRGKKSGFVEPTDWQCWGMRDWKPLWSGIAWNSWPTIVLSLAGGERERKVGASCNASCNASNHCNEMQQEAVMNWPSRPFKGRPALVWEGISCAVILNSPLPHKVLLSLSPPWSTSESKG